VDCRAAGRVHRPRLTAPNSPPETLMSRIRLVCAVVVTWSLLLGSVAFGRVVTVDTIVDDAALTGCDDDTENDCSLRGALVAAAGAAEHYDVRVPSGTYKLTAS